MKITVVNVLIALVGASCSAPSNSEVLFFENWTKKDTVITPSKAMTALAKHSDRDSLLGRITFWHSGLEHFVTAWTDEYYAPIDGGSYMLELDSLGIIYRHSTTWRGYSVVSTPNDSLDDLIVMALGAAMRPAPFGLRYLPPVEVPQIDLSTVEFTNLEIHDTATGDAWGK